MQRDERTALVRRRIRQLGAGLRAGGMRPLIARAATKVGERLLVPDDGPGVAIQEVLAPVGATLRGRAVTSTAGLRIGWIIEPPSAGSGGHTTLLRFVRDLERRGHENRIYVYDRHCPGDVASTVAVLRAHFPRMGAVVADAAELVEPPGAQVPALDALIATSWPTAYVLRRAATSAARCYLVQDFEPSFHPAGSDAALAEATYTFGLHGITAGRWLAAKLRRDYGMSCDPFDFGVDADSYRVRARSPRSGIVFYARPLTPRRGYELGMLALQRLAADRPDIDIHLFGEDLGRRSVPFAATCHGVLTPAAINELLNRCAAGLVLSLTNLSLLPLELLAAGCIPVVNDGPNNREVFDNPYLRYVAPTPDLLAAALAEESDRASVSRAEQASASVSHLRWEDAGAQVESALLHACARPEVAGGEERSCASLR
jgi:glycosyltransferase involved in cell wall biosynthesis